MGGHACHTGQFFIDQDIVDASQEISPYSTNETTMTKLSEDIIYDQSGTTGGLLDIRYAHRNRLADGIIGSITVGVDPDETNDNDTMSSMSFGGVGVGLLLTLRGTSCHDTDARDGEAPGVRFRSPRAGPRRPAGCRRAG